MGPLDHPAPGPPVGVLAAGRGSHPPLRNVREVPAAAHCVVCRLACVPLVRAEVLAPVGPRLWAGTDDLIERGLEQRHIMPLSPAHDEGQRDSIRVDEEAALGALFFPDPLGSARRLPGRAGL